ncbi:MAG TPA: DUF1345 domain-containing protein [Acidimicrobiales bacterium]|nr:DUF1345 domain-containing protein [Acidimicrobiales bacterium]
MPGTPTTYHRMIGTHAPALNRLLVGLALGVAVAVVLAFFVAWQLAVLAAWDTVCAVVLAVIWHEIYRSDSTKTRLLATKNDETRNTSRILVNCACIGSLVGVAFALHRANQKGGDSELLLVGVALLTVVLSWTLVNTVFTLHYAHLYYTEPHGGVEFTDDESEGPPDYRDFAYLAFTVGMCYQVSDTSLSTRHMRRTALRQGIIAYIFGVVIVATTINIIAGFL